jgi:hypothetical protein
MLRTIYINMQSGISSYRFYIPALGAGGWSRVGCRNKYNIPETREKFKFKFENIFTSVFFVCFFAMEFQVLI